MIEIDTMTKGCSVDALLAMTSIKNQKQKKQPTPNFLPFKKSDLHYNTALYLCICYNYKK